MLKRNLILFLLCFFVSFSPKVFAYADEAYKIFEGIARDFSREIIHGFSDEIMKQFPNLSREDMAEDMTREIVLRFRSAFYLTESQARFIVQKRYSTKSNQRKLPDLIKEIRDLKLTNPVYIDYLIAQYKQRQFTDLQLDFTVRLFQAYVDEMVNENI